MVVTFNRRDLEPAAARFGGWVVEEVTEGVIVLSQPEKDGGHRCFRANRAVPLASGILLCHTDV